MFLFPNSFKVNYSPEDVIGGNNGLTKQDIFDELDKEDNVPIKLQEDNTTDDKKDEKESKKTDDTKSEDDEKVLKDLEEDLDDDDDDEDENKLEDELIAPVRRKELLKAYPDIFEKFPYVERAIYKVQKYGEMFPTLDDAETAVKKSNALDGVESDLLNGNIEKLLATAKYNPNGFNKIVDNYLTTLQKVDEKAYTHVLGNVISHTVYSMVQEAKRTNNEGLRNAALLLNQFIFSTSEYIPPKTLTTETKVDPEREKLNTEKQEFLQDRFNTANSELSVRVSNSIRVTIEENIDPKKIMTDYVRKNAVREAMENVNQMLIENRRFRAIVDKLWEQSAKNNFNNESTNRLRAAFLSQARVLLPTAIKKAKIEALRGMGKRVSNEDNDDLPTNKAERAERRTTNEPGRSNNRPQDRNKPQPGESSLDFLMRD